MAKFRPVYADSVDSIESRKRKGNRVPLPYLIRPHRKFSLCDSLSLYNDYVEGGLESDEDDSSMEDVETSSLDKGNCFGLRNKCNASLSKLGHSLNDEKDDEYVIVDNVEAFPNSAMEKPGAIQMVLSKDGESESKDAGSSDVDWVVV